jgi:hypothetical protein
MTSRTLLNLVLALSLAGLIALAIYEPGKGDKPAMTSLTQLDPKNIQQIHIQSSGQPSIELKKVGDHWRMLAPFSVSANQERITQLLKITQANSHAAYPMDQVDARQLQLDKPMLTLTLDDVSLRFGTTAPLGGSRYVQVGQRAHLITDRYSHLVRAATGLISPTLLDNGDKITGLHLPTLDLKLDDGRWRLANKDAAHQPNPDNIQRLLDEWRYARALDIQALVTSSPTKNSRPSPIIEVVTESGTRQFVLQQTKDELVLKRLDLGLQYHFSREGGQRLLNLPAPKQPANSKLDN